MTTPSSLLSSNYILPTNHADGTRTALVAAPPRRLGQSMLWSLHLPDGLAQEGVSGRFFLARCGAITDEERAEEWSIYRRRPLYAAFQQSVNEPPGMARWDFLFPAVGEGDTAVAGGADPGYRWLAGLPVGTPVNLLGPFGQGYTLEATSRNLLLMGDTTTVPLVLGLGEQMLDRGGRVTLLLHLAQTNASAPQSIGAIVDQLPIAFEVRTATTNVQWQEQLAETIRWADQIAVALPAHELPALRNAVAQNRFRVETGFVQALIQADLLCGVGSCLACVVPTAAGGYTRACIHGPVFDLTTLV
ncbi:MAG TPA: hypothetical protein P5121_28900 [Caldilineaceae bacterium]|nr:hypothetical protein [Caldilineaceae bacterium]